MAWGAIKRAGFKLTIDGTTTDLYWHIVEINALDLWIYDAGDLLKPVWEWQRTSGAGVKIGPSYRAATIGIVSEASTIDDLNALNALCTDSIAAGIPGEFYIALGNTYSNYSHIRCYMVPGAISDWQYKEGFMRQEFDIVPVDGFWWRTLGNNIIQPGAYGIITAQNALGIDVDLEFSATAGTNPNIAVTPQPSSTTDFRNVYGFTAADVGEAFISTRDKVATIDGANAYDKRMGGAAGSGSYIFEVLPSGVHRLTNNSTGVVNVTTYQRLAAPRWI